VLKLGLFLLVLLVVGTALVALRPDARAAFDRARFPRHQFAIEYGNSEYRLDTAKGTVMKHGAGNPPRDLTIPLQLSDGALDHLYAVAIETRMFDTLEPHPRGWRSDTRLGRLTGLRLRAGEAERNFFWTTNDVPNHAWIGLLRFAAAIDSTVHADPGYRSLPPARPPRDL
jgi:hypothetical protein